MVAVFVINIKYYNHTFVLEICYFFPAGIDYHALFYIIIKWCNIVFLNVFT